jgi:hypothetical protein
MRNEAPVIVLAEWAARVNAETRACMGVVVRPELPERQEARAYLAGLMSDQEAAACVAADLARVRNNHSEAFGVIPDDLAVTNVTAGIAKSADNDDAAVTNVTADDDEYAGLSSTFAAACRAADEKQSSKPPDPPSRPAGVARSTLKAAEYLVRAGDAEQLQRWLAKHGAEERTAIQKHLGGKRAA